MRAARRQVSAAAQRRRADTWQRRYGAVQVLAGALALTGVVDPAGAEDRTALRGHVLLWDPWFALWGLALVLATWRRA